MSYFRQFIYSYFKPKIDPGAYVKSYVDRMILESNYDALKEAFEAGWKAGISNRDDK